MCEQSLLSHKADIQKCYAIVLTEIEKLGSTLGHEFGICHCDTLQIPPCKLCASIHRQLVRQSPVLLHCSNKRHPWRDAGEGRSNKHRIHVVMGSGTAIMSNTHGCEALLVVFQ